MPVRATVFITKVVSDNDKAKDFYEHILFLIAHANVEASSYDMPDEPFTSNLQIIENVSPPEVSP